MSLLDKPTSIAYDEIINLCKNVFVKKMQDYGTAWRVMRISSITDQIFIKAKRIRTLENSSEQKIDESTTSEYIGIINYAIIGLIQMQLGESLSQHSDTREIEKLYTSYFQKAKSLMIDKNHDYGEAWRDMRISSMTDLILMKLLRVKSIENNNGNTIISEGIDANYFDIINYAVFALIKMSH